MRQIGRAEWIRRFGERLGTAGHRPPEPAVVWHGGAPLGAGDYGEVRSSRRDPGVAVKRIPLTTRPILEEEILRQARLGNEFNEAGEHVGLMPPVQRAVTAPAAGTHLVDGYIEMPNLNRQGYRTLGDLAADPAVPEHYVAQVAAEDALNRAWSARAGILANDHHPGNAMALQPGLRSSRPDGERTQLIDAGMFGDAARIEEVLPGEGRKASLRQQAENIASGYIQLGDYDRAEQFVRAISTELDVPQVSRGDLQLVTQLVDGALSDLATQAATLDAPGWKAIREEALKRTSKTQKAHMARLSNSNLALDRSAAQS